MPQITGVVLAAGAGTRMGMPKALVTEADGTPWVAIATRLLHEAGCDRVVVVLGARADEAAALVPSGVDAVIARDWADGLSASIRAGLSAATGDAILLTLVDLPRMPVEVARRVLANNSTPQNTLRQAVFDGRPGHPVLIGRSHWEPLAATLSGDRGARAYLVAHNVDEVECADLWDGADIDA